MTKRTSVFNPPVRKFLIFEAWAEQVMLGGRAERVPSNANLRCTVLSFGFEEILFELYRANSARAIYEAALDLPLDDLFYVGGQLQCLIKKAETSLAEYESTNFFLDYYARDTMRNRIEEAKSFRRYIIRRIRKGF